MPTAAVLVIGNEILTGKFPDENGPYLIQRFRTLGCDLQRLVVLPDVIEDIAQEVRSCQQRFDHVITSGGVGPTHDDVTLEAIAVAFRVPLEINPQLFSLFESYSLPDNDATRRMSSTPRGATLVHTQASSYPILLMENVVVLPGVPKLFRHKFEAIAKRFVGEQVFIERLFTKAKEWDIAAVLTTVAAGFPQVAIGSYPRFGEGDFHVIVTLESRDRIALTAASTALQQGLPELITEVIPS